ncbi:hypothetical protein AUJ17_05845 [Candidatus Micrarchaeota archaeon CG1_02_47_40]|nr:MAG: hypothetical protein AUJ17_05845 [Candidatus Micrarchaeota archaeon CG1_02_47_40]
MQHLMRFDAGAFARRIEKIDIEKLMSYENALRVRMRFSLSKPLSAQEGENGRVIARWRLVEEEIGKRNGK